jgi:hypothetical protein
MKPNNVWAFDSAQKGLPSDDLLPHIRFLKDVFKDKVKILRQLSEGSRSEVVLWIWMETEDAGVGMELPGEDIAFFGSLCNRINISVIASSHIG